MKILITLMMLVLPLVAQESTNLAPLQASAGVSNWVSQVKQAVAMEQIIHMQVQDGGQYKSTATGQAATNVVEGFELAYWVDTYHGDRGIALVIIFQAQRDGERLIMRSRTGPYGETHAWRVEPRREE